MKYDYRNAAKSNFFIFIIGLFLSGCGDNKEAEKSSETKVASEGAQPLTAKNACQLLTPEDASAVLEGDVTQGMNTASMCQYLTASEELSKTGESVTLTIHVNGASEYEKYLQDTERDMAVKTEPVQGIGDKAAWAEGSLIVAHGNDLMVILVGKRMEKAAHMTAAKSLAQKIISRK